MATRQEDTRARGAGAAHAQVYSAIQRGDLPRARTLSCVDCGRDATAYDHRNYNFPLKVDAVCGRCNKTRGLAVPLISYKPSREMVLIFICATTDLAKRHAARYMAGQSLRNRKK